MKTTLYTASSAFSEFEPIWNELLDRSYSNSVFSTWEWVSTWWDVYQPGRLYIIGVTDESGELVGLAPWYLDSDCVIRGIGCVDVTDYIDVIVDRQVAEPVLECIGDFVANDLNLGNIEICNIPGNSMTLKLLSEVLRQRNFDVEINRIDVCPVLELPESWDKYLEQLDKKQRHEIRRKIRRVYGPGLDVSWYTVNGTQDLDSELDQFLKLMAASDPQKSEFLADENNVRFFRRLAQIMHERGWLQLNFLKINNEYVSAYFNLEYDNQVLVYNSGLSYESYGYLSPGIVLLAHIVRRAIENKRVALDFLRGDEVYKYRMGGKDTEIFVLTARPQRVMKGSESKKVSRN